MSLTNRPHPALAAFWLAAAMLWTAPMAHAQDKPAPRTITVSATGTAVAEPDIAIISTGVVSEAITAKDALAHNTADMRKVIDGLKASGIAAKDIQTSSFNVQPRYDNSKDGRAPRINGYRVYNSVRFTVRDLKRFGELLDQVVTLGANQIGGIEFRVSKAEELKDEARGHAMANALRRAKLYAAAAGSEIGQVLSISEEVYDIQPRAAPMTRTAMAGDAVAIEAGSQSLEAKVHVVYALK